MKFRKYGHAFLALAVSLGLGFGVTSCSNSYTVAYLYVTGSQYNQIGGFNVYNDNGKLTSIQGSPFGSGGTNPVRAIVLSGGNYLYVLNQGTFTYNSDGSTTGTASNVALFQIGGNGKLTFQANYSSQGSNSVSFLTDSSGSHLYVLDQYQTVPYGTNVGAPIPSSSSYSSSTPCLNQTDGRYYPAGDVTAFNVDPNTGRLSLITNAQVSNPNNTQLTYFPLGCFPTDFRLTGGTLFTIQQGSTTNNDLQTVFSYAQTATNGQLTLTQNAPLQTGAGHLTYIGGDAASKYIYLLDAGPVNCSNSGGFTSTTQILPYTIGTGGVLQSLVGGAVCNDPTATNPIALITDSKSKFLYVANNGLNTSSQTTPASEITAFTIDPTTGRLAAIAGQPFGTDAGPRCILEDPSNQYVYTANFNASTVTGKIIDTNAGVLNPLRVGPTSFATVGNPTWCVSTGRTQ